MIRIACVGISVMDRIYYLKDLPTTSGKYVANNYTEIGGGPAATAAVAAANLGAKVDFIGRVGDDDIGHRLLEELVSFGVRTDYIKRYQNSKSSQSAIMVDTNGERLIINYPSPDLANDASWIEDIDFSQWDVVLADVRWHNGAKQALTQARVAGTITILDGDTTPQNIHDLVSLSDHAVFSEPGLTHLTGINEIENALKQAQKLTDGHVYVTRGCEGCNWIENNIIKHQCGYPINVVDTTGAGDVFHGAFAFILASGANLEEAVKFASGVAALKCTRSGGREGIPSYDQTQDFLGLFV